MFGGIDPSSGTACLMEIAKALGLSYKQGEFATRQNRRAVLWSVSSGCQRHRNEPNCRDNSSVRRHPLHVSHILQKLMFPVSLLQLECSSF